MASAFAPRHRAGAPRSRPIGLRDQTFAVANELEVANQVPQFVVLQQEARVRWMTDVRLIDEKSFGEQDSSRFECACELGEQRAIEKVDVDDRVKKSFAKRESIEVRE